MNRHPVRRWARVTAATAMLALGVAATGRRRAGATPTVATATPAPPSSALTNLDHLDWLSDPVTPPDAGGPHDLPAGGGAVDRRRCGPTPSRTPTAATATSAAAPTTRTTDTWGQGAFNADDMTRAAVVYLRHWQDTGAEASRDAAYEMLRGVTYLQTATGPYAGNVVLWMQPDGTLNPSAEPVELPDPSDSDASYWVARTIWALGEGYAAFADADPEFAAFLRDRLELSIDAVDRQVLDAYGDHLDIDGQRTPAWLIADGADATAEAVLGLVGVRRRRRLGEGTHGPRQAQPRASPRSSGGDAQTWPFGRHPPVGALALGVARLGLADAGRAGPRRRSRWTTPAWPGPPSRTRSRSTRGC